MADQIFVVPGLEDPKMDGFARRKHLLTSEIGNLALDIKRLEAEPLDERDEDYKKDLEAKMKKKQQCDLELEVVSKELSLYDAKQESSRDNGDRITGLEVDIKAAKEELELLIEHQKKKAT